MSVVRADGEVVFYKVTSAPPLSYEYSCPYCVFLVPYGGHFQPQDVALTKILEHMEIHE